VAVVAGSFGFHGAAVLATRGAQRAQPGLTTVFTQPDVYAPVASQLQSAMVNVWPDEVKKMSAGFDALLVGPGLAAPDLRQRLSETVPAWWQEQAAALVVDASGLDFLAPGIFPQNRIRVITPHPGEAARMLGWTSQQVQADRVAALRELSKKFGGCWVVLKGHETLVGRGAGTVFINSSGNAHLAQGGSGDLLAGFITGLLAQPDLAADVETTLRYAVWAHGAAADQLTARRHNWTVEDLSTELGNAH
jgi:NAD(P)H-hydrate epimerase